MASVSTTMAPFHPSKRVMSAVAGMLTVAFSFICAALSGHSSGWLYYEKKNFTYFLFETFPLIKPKYPFALKIWVGYVRSTTSIRMYMSKYGNGRAIRYWQYLWEVEVVGAVIGWMMAATLILGFFLTLTLLIIVLTELFKGRGATNKLAWPRFLPFKLAWITSSAYSLLLWGMTILFYIASAIGVDKQAKKDLRGQGVIAWPDWCWWLTIIAAALWTIVAVLLFKEHKREIAARTTPVVQMA